jgi:hypothetical protein
LTFLRKLLLSLACVALAAVTAVLIFTAALLNTARQQLDVLPEMAISEMNGIRTDLRAAFAETTAVLDRNLTLTATTLDTTINRQADATRDELQNELKAFRTDANRLLADAVNRADTQLTNTNDSIARIASIADPVRGAAEKITIALPFYTDCDAGMCLANVIYGIGKNTERTLRAVDKTMEVIAATSPAVAGSVERSASAVEMRSRQSILRNLFFSLNPQR